MVNSCIEFTFRSNHFTNNILLTPPQLAEDNRIRHRKHPVKGTGAKLTTQHETHSPHNVQEQQHGSTQE
jgi:hypothetical protein